MPLDDPLLNGAFGSRVMLPVQYNDLVRRGNVVDGERKLMIAVLCAAIHDYLANSGIRTAEERARFAEVDNWLNDRAYRRGLFSFEGLCEALRIDAGRLREGLRLMRIRQGADRVRAAGYPSRRYRGIRRTAAGL